MTNDLVVKEKTNLEAQKTKEIRLNKYIKDYLKKVVPKIIDISDEQSEIDKQSNELTEIITKYFENKYDKSELEILKKYNYASEVDSVRLDKDGRRIMHPVTQKTYSVFILSYPVLLPSNYDGEAPAYIIDYIDILKDTCSKLEAAKSAKVLSYTKLIDSAKTLNELQKVWIDVGTYFKQYADDNGLSVTVNEEMLNLVLSDSEKRINKN